MTDHEPIASANASERVAGRSIHGQRIDTPSLPGESEAVLAL